MMLTIALAVSLLLTASAVAVLVYERRALTRAHGEALADDAARTAALAAQAEARAARAALYRRAAQVVDAHFPRLTPDIREKEIARLVERKLR